VNRTSDGFHSLSDINMIKSNYLLNVMESLAVSIPYYEWPSYNSSEPEEYVYETLSPLSSPTMRPSPPPDPSPTTSTLSMPRSRPTLRPTLSPSLQTTSVSNSTLISSPRSSPTLRPSRSPSSLLETVSSVPRSRPTMRPSINIYAVDSGTNSSVFSMVAITYSTLVNYLNNSISNIV
jgi:hypothetical protein